MEQMNITSARYVAIGGENNIIKATIDGVEYAVPLSDTNRHYAEIMRQVEAGELTIQPADGE
jgi:hypothetical protein